MSCVAGNRELVPHLLIAARLPPRFPFCYLSDTPLSDYLQVGNHTNQSKLPKECILVRPCQTRSSLVAPISFAPSSLNLQRPIKICLVSTKKASHKSQAFYDVSWLCSRWFGKCHDRFTAWFCKHMGTRLSMFQVVENAYRYAVVSMKRWSACCSPYSEPKSFLDPEDHIERYVTDSVTF